MGHNSNSKLRHPKRRNTNADPYDPKGKLPPRNAALKPKPKFTVPNEARIQTEDTGRERIIFRFDVLDIADDCPWSILEITHSDHRLLLERLKLYEEHTMKELLAPKFSEFKIYNDFSTCKNKEAIARLSKEYWKVDPKNKDIVENDEDQKKIPVDSIARFELDGKKRLYGFLVQNEFHIVWWDPNHQVWPSTLKNT